MGMIPGGGGDVPSPRQDMRQDFISLLPYVIPKQIQTEKTQHCSTQQLHFRTILEE